MRKIGILTYHRAHNYGAVLQCYALKETLKRMGNDVEVIDYRQQQIEENYKYLYFFSLQELKSLRGFKKIKYLINRISKDFIRYIIYRKRKSVFESFQKKHLCLSSICHEDIPTNYDVYVIGSDMLWDDQCMKGHFDPVFFGDFKHKETSSIVGYAISGSPSSFKRCAERYGFEFINNFSALSIREKVLADLLSQYIKREVQTCLDPTLLTDSKVWAPLLNHSWEKKKYIVTYYLRVDNENRQHLNKKVKVLADKMGCEVVNINIGTNATPITVEDFVSIIKYADFVLTDSFHGVIFSLIFHTKFNALKVGDSHDARYVDILEKLSLGCLLMTQPYNPEFLEIDYQMVETSLAKLRQASLDYLSSNI